MRCLPGGQPRIEEPEMAFLTSPCSLPQNLVSIPCRSLINLCRSGLELVWKLLIRLALSAVGWVGTSLGAIFLPVLRENTGGTRRQPGGPCGASTSTLTPRAATVSSRQVSSSTGTPFLMRSARERRSAPGISTGASGCCGGDLAQPFAVDQAGGIDDDAQSDAALSGSSGSRSSTQRCTSAA